MSYSTLHLESINGSVLIPSANVMGKAEAASVMFLHRGHTEPVTLKLSGHTNGQCVVHLLNVDDQKRNAWKDIQEAVEEGACGIAMMLVDQYTEYRVSERSVKGEGIDYWLSKKTDNINSLNTFNLYDRAARLEVSGIEQGTQAQINQRIKQKKQQTAPSANTNLPAFVVIVEFSTPCSALEIVK
jgi:hypothetical protein